MRTVVLALTLASAVASAAPGSELEPEPADPLDPAVVGGTLVVAGSWRDAAGVFFGPAEEGPGCTGVLVAPNLVLTARHCLGGIEQVLLDATSWITPDGEFIPVTQEFGHPTLDLGALLLARDAGVPPRIIASGCVIERHLKNDADVAIVGYGAIDAQATQLSTGLREAYSTVVDADCSTRSGCQSPGQELGAGGGGVDSCNGDSGGPLYLLTEHYDYLVGITSRAFFDATVPCSEGGIYVRPDAVISWIESTVGVTIPRADCNTPPDPVPATLRTESGKIGSVVIDAGDVDEGNVHTIRVLGTPMFGEATTDEEGVVYYRSFEDDYVGADSFMVEVTDNGVPAFSVPVVVQVEVVEASGCGCRASRGPGVGGLVLAMSVLVGLGLRRRRDARPF